MKKNLVNSFSIIALTIKHHTTHYLQYSVIFQVEYEKVYTVKKKKVLYYKCTCLSNSVGKTTQQSFLGNFVLIISIKQFIECFYEKLYIKFFPIINIGLTQTFKVLASFLQILTCQLNYHKIHTDSTVADQRLVTYCKFTNIFSPQDRVEMLGHLYSSVPPELNSILILIEGTTTLGIISIFSLRCITYTTQHHHSMLLSQNAH